MQTYILSILRLREVNRLIDVLHAEYIQKQTTYRSSMKIWRAKARIEQWLLRWRSIEGMLKEK